MPFNHEEVVKEARGRLTEIDAAIKDHKASITAATKSIRDLNEERGNVERIVNIGKPRKKKAAKAPKVEPEPQPTDAEGNLIRPPTDDASQSMNNPAENPAVLPDDLPIAPPQSDHAIVASAPDPQLAQASVGAHDATVTTGPPGKPLNLGVANPFRPK